jgi:DNA-binding GntR family transcriptional regulator
VSRTPIREAIRKLQASGAVEMVPHRGALVRGPSLRDILESYMVRAELEGFAAELAASMLNEEQLQTLRRAETMFEEAARRFAQLDRDARMASAARDAWIAANDSFHLAVQRAANNDRLLRSIADLHTSFPRSLASGPLIAIQAYWTRTSPPTGGSPSPSSSTTPPRRAERCASMSCAPGIWSSVGSAGMRAATATTRPYR